MKKAKITYWIFTSLFALMMLGSSIPDILCLPAAVTGVTGLGYPVYFIPFIGVAKFLGVVALLTPGFPRLKEWAYAGLSFDLIAAVYSLIAKGLPSSAWLPMILPVALAVASYISYQRLLRLRKTASTEREPATETFVAYS